MLWALFFVRACPLLLPDWWCCAFLVDDDDVDGQRVVGGRQKVWLCVFEREDGGRRATVLRAMAARGARSPKLGSKTPTTPR
jgi:hypothetical protein